MPLHASATISQVAQGNQAAPMACVPATTPAKRRLLFSIFDFRFSILESVPSTSAGPHSPRPSPPGRGCPRADGLVEPEGNSPPPPAFSPSPPIGGRGLGRGGPSSI